jgi:hypothetical protein
MVGSVVKAADLDDTIADLKDVQKSVEETGRSVSQMGKAIQKPLDETLKEARDALDPSKSTPQPEGETAAAGTGVAVEPASQSQEAGEVGEGKQDRTDLSTPEGAGQQRGPGDGGSQPVPGQDPGEASPPGGSEDERTSE